jgi:hypothetical protein
VLSCTVAFMAVELSLLALTPDRVLLLIIGRKLDRRRERQNPEQKKDESGCLLLELDGSIYLA